MINRKNLLITGKVACAWNFINFAMFSVWLSIYTFRKRQISLGITQPSLSQQIDKLEKELGVRLFERKTRSVKVTADGEVFMIHAQRVLAEVDHLAGIMKNLAQSKKERLGIGTFVPNMGSCKLAGLFQQFREVFPDISIHLSEKSGSHELYKLLKSGLIEGAFLVHSPGLISDHTIVRHTLIPGTVNIIIKKDHALATQKTILLQDLVKEKLRFHVPNLQHIQHRY